METTENVFPSLYLPLGNNPNDLTVFITRDKTRDRGNTYICENKVCMCVGVSILSTSTFKSVRNTAVLTRIFPTIDLSLRRCY